MIIMHLYLLLYFIILYSIIVLSLSENDSF